MTWGSTSRQLAPINRLPGPCNCCSAGWSLASTPLASGISLAAVSARPGRGSIRTTQEIYSHMIHGQDGSYGRDSRAALAAFRNPGSGLWVAFSKYVLACWTSPRPARICPIPKCAA